jgi:hypothetical protein
MSFYTLPAATMLEVLAQRQHTGQLETTISLKERSSPCSAVITMHAGKISACRIFDQAGQLLLEGEQALQALLKAGDLTWKVTAAPPSLPASPGAVPFQSGIAAPSFPGSTSGAPALRPLRLYPQPLAGWPRRWTQVFLLVDGIRDSEQIALLLRISLEETLWILRDLEAEGAITWRSP